jgi:LPXTG-motif cell wall-anchored protein
VTAGGTTAGATGGATTGGQSAAGGKALAHTGTDVLVLVPLSAVALIGGALLVRRRQSHRV